MTCTLLVLVWAVWCVLHSLFARPWFAARLKSRHPSLYRYRRLLYNGFAVVTLVPVLVFSHAVAQPPTFRWEGWLRIPQAVLILISFWLFAAGGQRFDLLQLLGLRQVNGENDCAVITEDCRVDTAGILGWIRHPWYTAGIIVVWARHLDPTAIAVNLLIDLYFVIGAILEERKLVELYGEEYRQYQRRVSMFVPFRRLFDRLGKRPQNPGSPTQGTQRTQPTQPHDGISPQRHGGHGDSSSMDFSVIPVP